MKWVSKKAACGLQDAAKIFCEKLCSILKTLEESNWRLIQTRGDMCAWFFRYERNDTIGFIIYHNVDILLCGDTRMLAEFKKLIGEQLDITDEGGLKDSEILRFPGWTY
eukprot:Filipodium_phascolosomae@DN421_c0_g1_i1.p1